MSERLRQRGSAIAHRLGNMFRRMEVALSSGSVWKLTGFEDDEGNVEESEADVFMNGTIYRPSAGAKVHAIVALVGGESGNAAVVALDDSVVRLAVEKALGVKAGERVDYGPGGSCVYHKSDGTVEIRKKDGTAVKLVTQAEFLDHCHATAGTGTPSGPITGAVPPGLAIDFPGTQTKLQ